MKKLALFSFFALSTVASISWGQTPSLTKTNTAKNSVRPLALKNASSSRITKSSATNSIIGNKKASTNIALNPPGLPSSTLKSTYSAKKELTQNETKTKNWRLGLSTTTTRPLVDHQDGSLAHSQEYSASLNIKMNSNYSLTGAIGYSQILEDAEGNDFTNTTVNVSRAPFTINELLNMTLRTGLTLPTSKESYKRQGLRAGLTGGATLLVNPAKLWTGLNLATGITFTKNIHEFEEAYDGAVNTEMSSSQFASISYGFKFPVSLDLSFVHINSWSYQGTMKDAFAFTQTVSYQAMEKLSIALGHTNSANTLKANGIDSNVSLYDENNSMVFLNASFSY